MEEFNLFLMFLLVFLVSPFRKVFFRKNNLAVLTAKKERNYFFDFIRGVAILAVLHIHTIWLIVLSEKLVLFDKLVFFFLNNLSRFAIAIFFISSGVLLYKIRNQKDLLSFFKKRGLKVFLPYFFVTIFLGILYKNNLKEIAYNLVTGNASVPFYFVVVLFQMYLIYPLLERFNSFKLLIFSFFVSFFSFLTPVTWGLWGAPLFFKYFFFFVYGVYNRERFLRPGQSQEKTDKNEKRVWLWLVFIYLVLAFSLPEYYFNIRLVYGIAVFNLFFLFRDLLSKQKLYQSLSFLGRHSLWIFLLHYPVFEALYSFWSKTINNPYLDYAMLFIVGTTLSVALSVFVEAVINKFKNFTNEQKA